MKTKLLLFLLFMITSFSGRAQSISFTAVPSSTEIGTILKVDYEYTIASAGQIYCGISLFDNWTYISFVTGQGLNPAPAGTNVTGTFNILIPGSTKPTSTLTGLQNYKVIIELKNASGTWLAGDYSVQNYNFTAPTAPLPSISFTSAIPSSTQIGTVLTVNYKYTLTNAGQIACGISLFDNFTYVSYVGGQNLNPAPAGTNVTGTFTILIPNGTVPTASLTGLQNYKIQVELKDAGGTWLAGDYPATQLNFTPSLGLDDKEIANGLAVYPNPVTNYLNLKNIENLPNTGFRILNVSGQTVQKAGSLNNQNIDVSNLKKGLYILSIDSKSGNKQFKFIKK